MTTIKEIMAQEKDLLSLLPAEEQVTYSKEILSVELTNNEIFNAIYKAKMQKLSTTITNEYSKKINALSQPRILTVHQLEAFVKDKSHNDGIALVIDKDNSNVFEVLCNYFAGHPDFEKMGKGYSFKKGIMLFGNVGCGKTFLMRMFMNNHLHSYKMVGCKTLSKQYEQEGITAIEKHYTELSDTTNMFNQNRYGFCYDDLGTEESKKHFGNELNVMADIILTRYNNTVLKARTHFTTNLSADDIEVMYGNRVRSRLREMVNLVEFDITAKDRRN